MTFEQYWETKGSRIQVSSHEERARLAWEAGQVPLIKALQDLECLIGVNASTYIQSQSHKIFAPILHVPNADLCGMSYKATQIWDNEGGSCEKEAVAKK